MWRFSKKLSREILNLHNLHFTNHLWSLRNVSCDCTVPSKQLLPKLIEWACVKGHGGTAARRLGTQEGLNLVLTHNLSNLLVQCLQRSKWGRPNLFLLGYPELWYLAFRLFCVCYLLSGSFHKPLILILQRANRMKTTIAEN